MTRHAQWRLSGWPAVLLLPLAIPAIFAVKLAQRLFGVRNAAALTAQDVAGYLTDFLEDRGGEWDWDDFTGIPIADPELDAIRRRADELSLPLTSDGREQLVILLQEVNALVRSG